MHTEDLWLQLSGTYINYYMYNYYERIKVKRVPRVIPVVLFFRLLLGLEISRGFRKKPIMRYRFCSHGQEEEEAVWPSGLGCWCCNPGFLGSRPPSCHWRDLYFGSSVILCKLIQLVCLLPVGIFNYVTFI